MPVEPLSDASGNEPISSGARSAKNPAYDTNRIETSAAPATATRLRAAVARAIGFGFWLSVVCAVVVVPVDAPALSNKERNSRQLWTRSSGYKVRQRSMAASNADENRFAPNTVADAIGSARPGEARTPASPPTVASDSIHQPRRFVGHEQTFFVRASPRDHPPHQRADRVDVGPRPISPSDDTCS